MRKGRSPNRGSAFTMWPGDICCRAMKKEGRVFVNQYQVLKTYFGYEGFRSGQEELIDAILDGQDVLGIMPTGAGKSICYQVPALCMEGITIVVSPLISLMMDQVKALNQAGVHAAYINSALTENQITKALLNASAGQYKIIYVAPERLETERFLRFAKEAKISMVTVDEAHCISQWGQDFRPSYLKVLQFIDALPKRPVVSAFTATATPVVKDDIVRILSLQDPKILVTGYDRENLYFGVRWSKDKEAHLLDYLQNHLDESGIVYCATRKNVDKVCDFLVGHGLPATKYHAGLTAEERKINQEDFIYDRKPIVVATNAFGMGIDKSNVRYVVHFNMPQSLENYYQEAGRAGRDGAGAECLILYSPQDTIINRYLIENKNENGDLTEEQAEMVKKQDIERLNAMVGYCKTAHCLREYILRYFGTNRWKNIAGKYCGNCSSCLREKPIRTFEQESRYENYSYGDLWEDEPGGYGYDRYEDDDVVRFGSRYETDAGYYGGSRYAAETRYGKSASKGGPSPYGTGVYGEKSTLQKKKNLVSDLDEKQQFLYASLKLKRKEIAQEEGIPPYIVFTDRTLLDMCIKLPHTKAEMLKVNGVGENKFGRYGSQFLRCIEENYHY